MLYAKEPSGPIVADKEGLLADDRVAAMQMSSFSSLRTRWGVLMRMSLSPEMGRPTRPIWRRKILSDLEEAAAYHFLRSHLYRQGDLGISCGLSAANLRGSIYMANHETRMFASCFALYARTKLHYSLMQLLKTQPGAIAQRPLAPNFGMQTLWYDSYSDAGMPPNKILPYFPRPWQGCPSYSSLLRRLSDSLTQCSCWIRILGDGQVLVIVRQVQIQVYLGE